MMYKIKVLLIITLFISYQGIGQNRIQINIPSAESESEHTWRTIHDIKFFEENHYQISLPKGELIEFLKSKAKSNNLTEKDYHNLKTYIQDSVYDKSDYQKGYNKIKNELGLINKMISEITESRWNWKFKEFDIYQINLTLYGPGGSYNSDEGSVLIYTTPNGGFKQYNNPVNTVIHEIIHIGIEESIVDEFQIPHTLKERIVDTFISLNFLNYLPDYRIQDMGDERIDPYLKNKDDLKNLDKFVKQIMK
ncbi:MAG: hypothetical protein WBG90_22370 [Saonia sp.]